MAELEQLSVTLSAKIDDFKRGMQEAVREFDRDAGQIEQRNLQLTQSMERSMGQSSATIKLFSGALKTLFSVYAVEQFISAIKRANEEMANLGKRADDTRISAQNITALRFAGIGQGADTKQIDAALDHFTAQSKKTEEDARGLYRALSQIDPAFSAAFRSAPTQTERLNVLSRAFGATSDETKKAQLSLQALGTDNERVISTFESAGGSLQTLADRAREAGIQIDDGLAKKAQEAQKQLDLMAEITSDKLKVAFAELVPFLQSTLEEISKIVDLINAAAASVQGFAGVAAKLLNLDRGGDKVQRNPNAPFGSAANPAITLPGEESPAGLPPRRPAGTGGSGGAPAFTGRPDLQKSEREKDDQFDREQKRIEKQIAALKGQAAAVGLVGEAAYKAEAAARLWEAAEEAGLKPTDALREKIDALADRLAKVKSAFQEAKLGSDLAFERSQIGRSADESAVQSRLRGSGVDPNTEAGEKLADEMRTIKNLTDAKEGASSFIKGMISDMENGVRAGKALENQLKRILEKLSDKALDKLISGAFGGIGGLFGGGGSYGASDFAAAETGAAPGAFGPGFASGGLVGRDGTPTWIPAAALRGARQFAIGGGVPAILHAGEIVLNQAQQKNVAQSMSQGPRGPINLTHAPVINGTGLSKEEVFSVIQRSQKEFSRQIGPIFSDWQRRYG
jgi:hypothetical protein